jgi:hypothetical protein
MAVVEIIVYGRATHGKASVELRREEVANSYLLMWFYEGATIDSAID